jgi:hypothetical protein
VEKNDGKPAVRFFREDKCKKSRVIYFDILE